MKSLYVVFGLAAAALAGCKPDTVKCPGTGSPAGYPDYHNGGDGTCVPLGECLAGYHDGGGGICLMTGCAAGYFSDGAMLCINDATQCTTRFHDDGSHMGCIAVGMCKSGFRLGGDGECVAMAMCSPGFHDGGTGNCLPEGECTPGYHDGGSGQCVAVGMCTTGFWDSGEGTCINDPIMCGGAFHDGGNHMSCVATGTCNAGWTLDGNGDCVGGPNGDGGVVGDGGSVVPTCCDAGPISDPCGGTLGCGLSTRSTVTFPANGTASTDVQLRVDLPVATWKGASTLRPDCADLVFREADGSWAPHWVEDCTSGRTWVRVKSYSATTGVVLGAHHGGATQTGQNFDRVFDRVPWRDPALVAAWTFDEGAGTASRNYGAPVYAWRADQGSSDMAVRALTAPQIAALWAPQGGGWGSRADAAARFSTGHAARIVDRTSWRTDPANTPRPQTGLTLGAWFTTTENPDAHGAWSTVMCYGARAGWPFDIANPFAMFMWESGVNDVYLQANSCHNGCTVPGMTNTMPGDYDHIATTRSYTYDDLMGAVGSRPKWHFMAMSLNFQTNERHLYFDGVDEPLGTRDRFLDTIPSTGPIFYIPDSPVVLGADLNDGVDGLTLAGDLDDVFILNRAATVAELTAFRERRRPITLPTASVTTP